MAEPRVKSLHYYPVKGMTGIEVGAWKPERAGLQYDRRWMFITPEGRFISQRRFPELVHWSVVFFGSILVFTDRRRPQLQFWVYEADRTDRPRVSVELWNDRFEAFLIEDPTVARLAAAMGAPDARLVYLGKDSSRPLDAAYRQGDEVTHFGDAFPYLITNTASLDALSVHCGEALDMSRFRPNIVLQTDTPWAEDNWKSVQIGPHRFRIDKACGRCQVVNIDQITGKRNKELLAKIGKLREQDGRIRFGVYAVWEPNNYEQPLREDHGISIRTHSD